MCHVILTMCAVILTIEVWRRCTMQVIPLRRTLVSSL